MKSFDKVEPIYFIDDEMNKLLDDIDNKLMNIEINDKQKRKYMITKSKVRSIHSSLSIEANSLSLFDVENISQNKQVLGKINEVQEVKNTIEAYNHINDYNYKSEEDFLKAKIIMTKYFDEDNGGYRNNGEGVKRNDKIIYIAPESILVPTLMKSLFDYLKKSDLNLIV